MTCGTSHSSSARSARRRGVALLMVIVGSALVTLVAFIALLGAGTRSHTAFDAGAAAQAEALAESGVALARHYLINAKQSPVPLAEGLNGVRHYPGQAGISLVGGTTLDVVVQNTAQDVFTITSTGTVSSREGPLRRRLVAEVRALSQWRSQGAAHFAHNTTLRSVMHVSGGVAGAGNLTISGASISGTIVAANASDNPGWALPDADRPPVPPWETLALVQTLPKYVYNGQICTADEIGGTLLSTPSAGPNNPGRVFFRRSGNLTLMSSLSSFDGSIVLLDGDLEVQTPGTITARAGLPALLVNGRVVMNIIGMLRINGVAYVRNDIAGTPLVGTTTLFEVRGSYLTSSTLGASPQSNFVLGRVQYLHVPSRDVPNLTTQPLPYDALLTLSRRWTDAG